MSGWHNEIRTAFSGLPEFPPDYFGARKPHKATLRLRAQILEVLQSFTPLGVRGVGYAVLNRFDGYGDKSDDWFDKIGEQIKIMRLNREISFADIIDESREIVVDSFWQSAVEMIDLAREQFRIDPWLDQPCAIMVVADRHGLAGILREVTQPLRLPSATLGGTCSHSFARDVAHWINQHREQVVRIFYLGDYDPSGAHIPAWLWREPYAAAQANRYDLDHIGSNVLIERLAINSTAQAQQFGAVMRQLSDEKLEANSHARDWPADRLVCEVDSIPPEPMQRLVREAIGPLIDQDRWRSTMQPEDRERKRFDAWIGNRKRE